MEISSDLLERLKASAEEKVKERLTFKATFINVTPWWGGDYNTDVIGDGNAVTLPTPGAVVGKTLWFMRTYYQENLAFSTEERSRLVVRVLGDAPRVDINKDTNTLYANVTVLRDLIRLLKEESEKEGKKKGRKERAKESDICKKLRDNELSDGVKEFAEAYCVPRVRQRLRDKVSKAIDEEGRKEETLLEVVRGFPVRPGSVKFTVEVYDEGWPHTKEFVKAMLFTLAYLGIGSGANRGFGRFYVNEVIHVKKEWKGEVEGMLRGFDEAVRSLSLKRDNVNEVPLFRGSGVRRVGVNADVLSSLRCIGDSTLKARLGKDERVWLLGLPRVGKFRAQSNVDGKVRDLLKRSSGQLQLDSEEIERRVNAYVKAERTDREREEKAIVTGYHFWLGEEEVERRQSYVVFSPVVGKGRTVEEILIIPFLAEDTAGIKGELVGYNHEKNWVNIKGVRSLGTKVSENLGVNSTASNSQNGFLDKLKDTLQDVCRRRTQGGGLPPRRRWPT